MASNPITGDAWCPPPPLAHSMRRSRSQVPSHGGGAGLAVLAQLNPQGVRMTSIDRFYVQPGKAHTAMSSAERADLGAGLETFRKDVRALGKPAFQLENKSKYCFQTEVFARDATRSAQIIDAVAERRPLGVTQTTRAGADYRVFKQAHPSLGEYGEAAALTRTDVRRHGDLSCYNLSNLQSSAPLDGHMRDNRTGLSQRHRRPERLAPAGYTPKALGKGNLILGPGFHAT